MAQEILESHLAIMKAFRLMCLALPADHADAQAARRLLLNFEARVQDITDERGE